MASNSNGNRINVPEAKEALSNMKYEIARELGVNLKQGYNGDLEQFLYYTDAKSARVGLRRWLYGQASDRKRRKADGRSAEPVKSDSVRALCKACAGHHPVMRILSAGGAYSTKMAKRKGESFHVSEPESEPDA